MSNSRLFTRREFLHRLLTGIGMGIAAPLLQGASCLRSQEAMPVSQSPPNLPTTPTPMEEIATTIEEAATPTPTPWPLHEARYYRKLEGNAVQCELCFRRCLVTDGNTGFCRNRINKGGTYYTKVYGRAAALQIDPIEKEPSFHMLPGTRIFCTGTASCNNRCKHCHNWHLSQKAPEEIDSYAVSPQEIVELAKTYFCASVSFTYNEPTVFYEFMFDVIKEAKAAGLHALFHTNGSMNAAPMLALLDYVDAVTVDLKAFTSRFYQEVSSSQLEPVLETLTRIRKHKVHLEIVNLIIPTLNDNMDDIRRMCLWIKENLGTDVPVHFNRFFPAYLMTHLPPTPIHTLEAAAAIADEVGLQYVYIGNTPGHARNSTYCPKCKERLIIRYHFTVLDNKLRDGKCPYCGHPIPGIWKR